MAHSAETGAGSECVVTQNWDATTAPGPWLTWLGVASAALILTGDLAALHVPGTALTNCAGYVLWSVWLVAFAVQVLRKRR